MSAKDVPVEAKAALHTPGPWEFRKAGVSIINHITRHFPDHVVYNFKDELGQSCTAFVASCEATTLPNEANARLIATSPDGLTLARRVVKYFGDGPIDPKLNADIELREMARALIFKAEGQAPPADTERPGEK